MMDLHKYPLDKQICDIRMESCKYAHFSYMYKYVDIFKIFKILDILYKYQN